MRSGTSPEDLVAAGRGMLAVTAVGSDAGFPTTIEPEGAVMVWTIGDTVPSAPITVHVMVVTTLLLVIGS